jgi:hypothetical protein
MRKALLQTANWRRSKVLQTNPVFDDSCVQTIRPGEMSTLEGRKTESRGKKDRIAWHLGVAPTTQWTGRGIARQPSTQSPQHVVQHAQRLSIVLVRASCRAQAARQ